MSPLLNLEVAGRKTTSWILSVFSFLIAHKMTLEITVSAWLSPNRMVSLETPLRPRLGVSEEEVHLEFKIRSWSLTNLSPCFRAA